MEKVCIKCSVSKDFSNFYNSKSHKDGKMGTCKDCFNIIVGSYRPKSYRKNKEKIKERGRKWRSEQQDYYKQWKLANLEHVKNYARNYKKTPLQKLKANIRTRIAQHISGLSKSKSTLEILGLESFEQLQKHIEVNFNKGMTWENYGAGEGKWVLDHKIPLALAENVQDVYKLNHFTNLQPMWWRENMEKGSKVR
jgi:hypothetical protein